MGPSTVKVGSPDDQGLSGDPFVSTLCKFIKQFSPVFKIRCVEMRRQESDFSLPSIETCASRHCQQHNCGWFSVNSRMRSRYMLGSALVTISCAPILIVEAPDYNRRMRADMNQHTHHLSPMILAAALPRACGLGTSTHSNSPPSSATSKRAGRFRKCVLVPGCSQVPSSPHMPANLFECGSAGL